MGSFPQVETRGVSEDVQARLDALRDEIAAELEAAPHELVESVTGWLNEMTDIAWQCHQDDMEGMQPCPVGANGKPVCPGDCVTWSDPLDGEDLDRFEVVGISAEDVMLRRWGGQGMFPDAVSAARAMVHAEPITLDYALDWFEKNIGMASSSAQRDDVYERAKDYVRAAV